MYTYTHTYIIPKTYQEITSLLVSAPPSSVPACPTPTRREGAVGSIIIAITTSLPLRLARLPPIDKTCPAVERA